CSPAGSSRLAGVKRLPSTAWTLAAAPVAGPAAPLPTGSAVVLHGGTAPPRARTLPMLISPSVRSGTVCLHGSVRSRQAAALPAAATEPRASIGLLLLQQPGDPRLGAPRGKVGVQCSSGQPGRRVTVGLAWCGPCRLRHDRSLLARARPGLMVAAGAASGRRLVVVFRGSPRGRTVIPRR